MEVAALLTAKGNSTLTDKNILPVRGKPLLWYPANAARRSKLISSFWASSDSQRILDITEDVGYRRIRRPPELARPESRHADAVLHALDHMKDAGYTPEILVVVLGNNVTTTTELIDQGIRLCMDDPMTSAAVAVFNDQDHHPFRAKRINACGFLEPFFDFAGQDVSTNRQELVPNYFLCHNFWVLRVDRSIRSEGGQKPWTFMGNNVRPIISSAGFDVHDRDDIGRCEAWLDKHSNE